MEAHSRCQVLSPLRPPPPPPPKDAWFGPHIDETKLNDDKTMESEFTMLIYLTGVDDEPVLDQVQGRLKGGATRFHHNKKAPIDVEPHTGAVCLHWQLHDCLHEGLRVLGGVKWLLRTDVYFPRMSASARAAAVKAAANAAGNVEAQQQQQGGKRLKKSKKGR